MDSERWNEDPSYLFPSGTYSIIMITEVLYFPIFFMCVLVMAIILDDREIT